MADVITRLKLESSEYDSKIKRATQGLLQMEQECRKVGGTLAVLEKDQLEFVKGLGQMETVSKNARGKLSELTQAYTELAMQYKRLTDEEKNGDFGKALSASLEQLKTRIGETKTQLGDITKEMNGGGGLKDALDAVAGKFGLSIDQVTKFGGVVAVTTTAVKVAKDAFFQSESNIDEWGRTVEGAKGAYDVFLQTINNGNWSNFFQNLSEAIRGARDLYDALDRLGSIKSNNQAAIAIVQQQIAQLRLAKQQGQDVDDQLKAATANLAALQKQAVTAGKNAGAATMQQTIRNGVNSMGGAAVSDRDIQAAIGGILHKGQAEFDKYKETVNKFENWSKAQKVTTQVIPDTQGGTYTKITREFDINLLTKEQQRQYKLAKAITERETEIQKGISIYAQAVQEGTANAREEFKDNRYALQGSTGGKGGSGGTSGKGGTTPADDIAKAEANYAATMDMAQRDLMENVITQKKYDETIFKGQQDLANAYNKAYEATGDEKYLKAYQETAAHVTEMQGVIDSNIEAQKESEKAARELANAQKKLTDAQNELADAQASGDLKKIYAAEKKVETAQVQVDARTSTSTGATGAVEVPITISNLDALKQHLTEEMATTPVGDSLLHNMQEAFSDASAIGTIFSTAVKNGIDTTVFDTSGIMQKLLNNKDIDDDIITSYVEQLNEQLKMKFDETEWPNVLITFNAETKQIENAAKKQLDDAKKTQQAWGLAAQSVNNLSTALANIEDPGAKAMGTVIKAIADISLGFAQASVQASSLGPWGWLAWLAAGTAAMATTISSVHSLTGFADGGIIKGNSYSGDRIGGMVDGSQFVGLNAGELVLNKSQQMNLASQLEGGGMGGLHLSTVVTAEDIKFILNNNGERIGVGEYFEP